MRGNRFVVSQEDTDKLHNVLEDPNTPLFDVLRSVAFARRWLSGDQQLLEFVLERFDQVLDCVFGMKPGTDRMMKLRCFDIVTSYDPIRTILFERGKLGEYVMNFLRKAHEMPPQKVSNFFSLVPSIVYSQSVFHPFFQTEEFFQLLLNLLHNEACAEFFRIILRKEMSTSARAALKRIKYCTFLVSKVFGDDPVLKQRALKLLVVALEEDVAFDILEPLIVNYELEQLIQMSLTLESREIFELLRVLVLKANEHIFALKWRRAKEIVNGHLNDFCIALTKSDKFTRPCAAGAKLVCLIFELTKIFSPELKTLVQHMAKLFFTLSANSSLHNIFVRLLKALSKTRHLNTAFIEEMDLYNTIIQCYQQREQNVTSCYWGQLREISNIINKSISKAHVDKELWRRTVIDENWRADAIMSKPYGGCLPGEEPQNTDMFFVGAVAVVILITTAIIVIPKLI